MLRISPRYVSQIILTLVISLHSGNSIWGAGPHRPMTIRHADGYLFVANQDGSLSILRSDTKRVTLESTFQVGEHLTDLAVYPSQHWLTTVDSRSGELVLLRYRVDPSQPCELKVVARHHAPPGSSRLNWLPDGRLIVSSVWGRQILMWKIVSEDAAPYFVRQSTIDLPFAPGKFCVTSDGQTIIAADAFGGHLARIQLENLRFTEVEIPGHNIRGLTMSPDESTVLVTHQMLNDFIPTTRDHVFWGNVVSSLLRTIPVDEFSASGPPPADGSVRRVHGSLFPLGQEGHAAGDPSEITISTHGDLCVCLTGVGEVAMRSDGQRRFRRIPVGRGPTSQVCFEDRLAVANRFDDSVTILQLNSGKVVQRIPLRQTPAEESQAERGERLFFDATLSLDGWFSCHSCHTDGHTCGLLNDNFGDETMGAPKRIPSLLGVGATSPYAWNGRHPNLPSQVRSSLQRTMHTTEEAPVSPADVDAIAAYLRTLTPPPNLASSRQHPPDPAALKRGRHQFQQLGCADCHVPPTYTSARTYDVGLQDEKGQHEFNPPSLRGLSHRSTLLHDGRISSLTELLQRHPTPDGVETDRRARQDLLTFLKAL